LADALLDDAFKRFWNFRQKSVEAMAVRPAVQDGFMGGAICVLDYLLNNEDAQTEAGMYSMLTILMAETKAYMEAAVRRSAN
jgi:hypothetical protein